MDYDKIVQRFVGKGKVQPLEIKEYGKEFALTYKEGDKTSHVRCEDRAVLEQILIEFGGKNPETCRADDMFLRIDGNWGCDDIMERGHVPVKVEISGNRVIRQTSYPITLPKNCGESGISGSRKSKKDEMNLKLEDRERLRSTVTFKEPHELDNLIGFLIGEEPCKNLSWSITSLVTENKRTKEAITWNRVKAGDGSKRMVLELKSINGKHYTECVRGDVFNAADDMFYLPCKRVTMKKKVPKQDLLCVFALEDGSIDTGKYEMET